MCAFTHYIVLIVTWYFRVVSLWANRDTVIMTSGNVIVKKFCAHEKANN